MAICSISANRAFQPCRGQTMEKMPPVSLEKILELDNRVDELIDIYCRQGLDAVIQASVDMLVDDLSLEAAFLQYGGPRTFDGREIQHITVCSRNTPEPQAKILKHLADAYRNGPVAAQGEDADPLLHRTDNGEHVLAVPMYLGQPPQFTGILGIVCGVEPDDTHSRLLYQLGSRLDTYIRMQTMTGEWHIVLNRVNRILDKESIHGIGDVLVLITALIGMEIGAVIYLEDALDPKIPPGKKRIGLVYVENGEIIRRPDMMVRLNDRLGGPMIDYDMNRIADSKYGMQVMGILQRNPETGEETLRNFHCMDLVNRYAENNHNVGKIFLIGDKPLDRMDIGIMEVAALQIDTQLTHYHEQKKALGRSLHPDQVDFFLRYPKIARWFFENPREELIAMVFSDICGYTTLTRKLGDPRKTIDVAKKWILREKELTLKHGGFFDKEVGDCAVSLFGPPFGAISLEALSRVDKIEDIETLIKANKWEPHVYAYHAVMYALDSMEAIRLFYMGETQMNIAVGIEVGRVALGDLTGDIGKLTAMGDSMNLAARLQTLARAGQILVGPTCAGLLETYRKEAYLKELPFEILDGGKASLKGYDEPVPYYIIRLKPL